MLPPFRILLSLRLGLLLATMGLVLGQGSSGRYDVLRGTGGESACTLQDAIVRRCTSKLVSRRDSSPSPILDRDNTSPVPSSCTCTTIFFNIWSACRYSTGNDTLPNLSQWTQKCTTGTIPFESSTVTSKLQVNLGVDIPSWATLTVPGNTSFDLQRAVSRSLPIRWTLLQIILPAVAAVSMLTISIVAFLIYERLRKSSQGSNRIRWLKGLKRLRLTHKATISSDKQKSWEIDQESAMEQSSFVNFSPSVEESKSPDQPIRVTSVFDPKPTDVHESEKPQMRPRSFRMPKPSSVRLRPWKQRPPKIKLVPATSRFRVDDADKSAHTCSVEANAGEGRNGFSEVNEEDPEDDDHAQYISIEDEETTNLITHSEERDSHDDVLLISKDGRPFTLESRSTNTVSVNSYIKVISPSISSASPRTSIHPLPTKPALHIPIPPPPPRHAAPAPPIMSRSILERPSGSSNGPYFLHHSVLSPIKEASPSRSNSSSNVSLRRSLALRRSSSNSKSVSSSLRISPAARSSPNLGTSTTRLPPDYSESLHRTASQTSDLSLARDVVITEDAPHGHYLEMSAVNGVHRRWISADDDCSDASFYCSSPEHVDPAAFFPGPVRAAGYPKTLLPTRDTSF